MFRARRYRVLLIFAAVAVLATLHFSRSRDWRQTAIIDTPSGSPSAQAPVANPNTPQLQSPAGDSSKSQPPQAPNSEPHGYRPSDGLKSPESSGSLTGEKSPEKQVPSPSGSGSSAPKDAPPKSSEGGAADSSNKIGSDSKTVPVVTGDISVGTEDIDRGGAGRLTVQEHPDGPAVHWVKTPERFPVADGSLIKLPTAPAKPLPTLQAKFKDESSTARQERLQRLSSIKAEFNHAWAGYKKTAMSHDEVKPLSEGFDDPFNGWGATLVDSLDTLWIMDLKTEFSEAVDAVKKIDFTTSPREDIPVFETVIRYLGGLLGAYDISGQGHRVLLEKAEELAEVLMGAFDTPNRMPVLYYRWTPEYTKLAHRAASKAVLAELGSLSLEFTRLAQLTKKNKYYDAVARITNRLEELQDATSIPGLWPLLVNAQGCSKYRPARDTLESSRDDAEDAFGPSAFSSSVAAATTTPSRQAYPTPSQIRRVSVASAELENNSQMIRPRADLDLSQAEPAIYKQSGESAGGNSAEKPSSEGVSPDVEKCDGGLELPPASRQNKYSLGGMADSTYEYLPKEYLLLGGVNDQYKKMYKKAMDAVRKNLLFKPMVKGKQHLRFVASTGPLDPTKKRELISTDLDYETSHLSCYLGGMVAMGAKMFSIDGDLDLAAKLTDGCVWAYEATNTGIMPERFRLLPCSKDKSCEWDEKLYQAEVNRYSRGLDKGAETRFRNGESSYGQRVKLNEDLKSKEAAEGGAAVPLPMPGSANPHDLDPYRKRDAVGAGRGAGAGAPVANAGPPSNAAPGANRAAPRPAFVSQSKSNEIHDRLPSGMTSIPAPEYLLRPEAIESVFIMYRLTGDDAWREKGWKMFEAITKHTRTTLAHAGIKDVTASKPAQKDSMESFWTAETLKYFYLLFSEPSVVDLDKYVLNTEAHPFLRPVS
ncbi:putative alpha-mannosidase [Penicillium oxalicum 114-2]|uniref:alpha-1,2-Mannosidase n=1 Tax=Penicillium oxalicum (strain 114-2 / CGMCC 5302) TaxID=933388 RepID=S7ZSB3_PENO1|nr:putative alpha-mannosidase [Penicillium oxalicum 114-2]